jgi:hypothetical protein
MGIHWLNFGGERHVNLTKGEENHSIGEKNTEV